MSDKDPTLRAALIMDIGQLGKVRLSWFGKRYQEFTTALKVVTGYGFDNRTLLLCNSLGGELFSFSLRKREYAPNSPLAKDVKRWFPDKPHNHSLHEASLWDHTGLTAIAEFKFTGDWNDCIPADTLSQIKSKMDDWHRGAVPCSDCSEEMPVRGWAGRYFAAVYCDGCWNGSKGTHSGRGGWKAVEAKETYS